MSEHAPSRLFEEITRRHAKGESVVLAVTVKVTGSTPRHSGARMLLLADGSTVGTVGGGVKDAEVLAAARELMRKGGSRLLALDFTDGLTGGPGPACGGTMEVFMERLDPPRRIVIAGAGHIGYFLHRVIDTLGMETVIFDPRPEFASAERFPGAKLLVAPFQTGLGGAEVGPNDGVVIVTPGHEHDHEVLRQALGTPARYIGMIGSRNKVSLVLGKLREEGFGEDQIARVHTPIGLDIGAETPAEIAVAIAAEIVAVLHGREMGMSAKR